MISEQRIQAQNDINALANEVEGHLLRLLSDWQGVKACKVSGGGGFVKKLRTEVDQYIESQEFNRHEGHNVSRSDWWLNVFTQYTSITATIRNIKTGQKVEMYLARFNEDTGELTSLCDEQLRRTNYTLEYVQANINKARELEEQARQLRSEVRDFSIR